MHKHYQPIDPNVAATLHPVIHNYLVKLNKRETPEILKGKDFPVEMDPIVMFDGNVRKLYEIGKQSIQKTGMVGAQTSHALKHIETLQKNKYYFTHKYPVKKKFLGVEQRIEQGIVD